MNPTSTPPAKSPVPRRRWWLRGTLAALALAIVTPLALVSISNFSAQSAWADAEDEASRDDPHWRLMDMEADRPQLADADNSALFIIALRSKGRIDVRSVPNYDKIFENLPINAQLNAQQVQLIRTEFAKVPGLIEEARKLKDLPEGRFPITFSDDFIGTLIPHHHEPREIRDWLQHDAWLLVQDGECDAAIESCQAIINAGRSMKDDPFTLVCLIRVNVQSVALDTLERVLAQGEASEKHLHAMQKMLEREMKQSSFILAIRGERAGFQHLFENVRNGKCKTNLFNGMPAGPGLDPFTPWLTEVLPFTVLRHYPDHLHHMNRTVAAARLTLPERAAKLAEVQAECRDTSNPITRLLTPALDKVEKADRRVQIYLRTMTVALACERYRLKHEEKRWPATLDDLVKAKLLDVVPTDPINDQPLRYRRTREGIVIYSIGFDMKDDQGNIDREHPYVTGVDLGFRLWDPEQRGRQPLPPVGLP